MALGAAVPPPCGGAPAAPAPASLGTGAGVRPRAAGHTQGWRVAGCPRGPRLRGGGLPVIWAASPGWQGSSQGWSLSLYEEARSANTV